MYSHWTPCSIICQLDYLEEGLPEGEHSLWCLFATAETGQERRVQLGVLKYHQLEVYCWLSSNTPATTGGMGTHCPFFAPPKLLECSVSINTSLLCCYPQLTPLSLPSAYPQLTPQLTPQVTPQVTTLTTVGLGVHGSVVKLGSYHPFAHFM